MRDRVFTGSDVAEAVAEASRSLGLAADRLRYVVLEAGAPGVRGGSATPARIVVLLADEPKAGRAPMSNRGPGGRGAADALFGAAVPLSQEDEEALDRQPGAPLSPKVAMRSALRALAEGAGIDVSMEIEEGPDGVTVRVGGADRDVFLEEDGDVLRALAHLFQRMAGRGESRRLKVHCEGYQEARDAALGEYARELAEAVRRDGRSRVTDPLNSYERRIIHMALTGASGIRTFSVGEGLDRRVTIAPNEGGENEGEPESR
jgi:spoIIIJ-associated protein